MKSLTYSRITSALILASFIGILYGCNKRNGRFKREVFSSESVPPVDKTREVRILTVFFGLDNGLTQRARALYKNAPGLDGMPVVLSHEVEPETLEGADFEVTTRDGSVFEVEYATLLPANEEFELRTALLIGE